MAITNLFRGGMPDFKGWFCDGQFAEFTPPFDAPHAKFTPPFDSHADAAHGQGYLNLHFPLVPNLNDTVGHRWMQYALKNLKAEGDVILTNWVPLRSYVDSVYYEANIFDANLAGVYAKPVAYRVAWDFDNEEWTQTEITAFASMLASAGIENLCVSRSGQIRADGGNLATVIYKNAAVGDFFTHNGFDTAVFDQKHDLISFVSKIRNGYNSQ